MSVNLLLIESPIWKLVSRQHHIHGGHCMLQLEMISLGGQHLSFIAIKQAQVEQGLVVALHLVLVQSGEFLMGGETGGCDVVGNQERVGLDVEELDDIIVANDPSTTSLGEGLSGNDHPIVVLVFMGVTRNLLALTANSLVRIIAGIALRVRM